MSSFEGKCLENWDVSKVTLMNSMFAHDKTLNADLSKWNVSNVKNMRTMFYNCRSFDCDLSNWDVSKVKDMEAMFANCMTAIDNGSFKSLDKWHISQIPSSKLNGAFGNILFNVTPNTVPINKLGALTITKL